MILFLERPILTALLNSLWIAVILASAAWLWERTNRHASPRQREIAWALALFLAVILPAASTFSWPAATSIQSEALRIVSNVTSIPAPPLADNTRWTKYVFAAYLAYLIFAAARFLVSLLRLRTLNEDNIRVPLTFGVIEVRILLPARFRAEAPSEAVEAAIAHESAHARQLDFAWNLLIEIVTLPVAFHPGVVFMKRRLAQARELVCDELAARTIGDRRRYTEGLLAAARFLAQPEPPSRLALGMLDHDQFEERIMTLSRPARSLSWRAAATLALLLAFTPALTLFAVHLQAADDKVYQIADGIKPPRLTYKEEPQYSPVARDSKIEGTVVLEVVISQDGLAESIKVIRELHHDLDKNAVAAVERWRFEPAQKDGKSVKARATIEVNFRLQ